MKLKEPEDGFRAAITELAELEGWRVYHVKNVKGQLRNETAVGFPDLVMARADIAIFAELKTETGRISKEQALWLAALPRSTYIWRPSDWDAIVKVLR